MQQASLVQGVDLQFFSPLRWGIPIEKLQRERMTDEFSTTASAKCRSENMACLRFLHRIPLGLVGHNFIGFLHFEPLQNDRAVIEAICALFPFPCGHGLGLLSRCGKCGKPPSFTPVADARRHGRFAFVVRSRPRAASAGSGFA